MSRLWKEIRLLRHKCGKETLANATYLVHGCHGLLSGDTFGRLKTTLLGATFIHACLTLETKGPPCDEFPCQRREWRSVLCRNSWERSKNTYSVHWLWYQHPACHCAQTRESRSKTISPSYALSFALILALSFALSFRLPLREAGGTAEAENKHAPSRTAASRSPPAPKESK